MWVLVNIFSQVFTGFLDRSVVPSHQKTPTVDVWLPENIEAKNGTIIWANVGWVWMGS